MKISLLSLVLAAACSAQVVRPPPEYPGRMSSTSELVSPLGEAFALDHRVTSESTAGRYEFRALLQRRAGELVLVILAPHGGRALVIAQRGDDLEVESHMPRELPFPPRYMLLDVQRTFFRGLGGAQQDGEHRAEVDGEEVIERWESGSLRERSYRRLDGDPQGILRIEYEGGMGDRIAPSVVRIDNGWFGYHLVIETLSLQQIDAP